MKYTSLFIVIVVFVVVFSLFGNKILPKYKQPEVQNPFLEFEDLESAVEYAEFDFSFPEELEGYEISSQKIRVLRADKKINRLVEVICFSDDKQEKELVRYRKSFGKNDISGDYQKYPVKEDADTGDFLLKMKGTQDGMYNATWHVWAGAEDGKEIFNSFSIMTTVPLSRQQMMALASNVF